MNTDDSMINALPETPAGRGRKRSGRRIGAVAIVAVFALGACTSDPGARRVAEDIIRAETQDDSSSDRRDCMLDVLDEDFSDSDLEAITDQISSTNEGSQTEGRAALDEFEAALAACN